MKRKARKAKRGITIRELKALSRAIVFERDGHKCVVCRRGKKDGVQLQWSHIVSQKVAGTRFLPENAVVHCASHHFAWHAVPPKWVVWWLEAYPHRWGIVQGWLDRKLSKAEWKEYLLEQSK